MDCRLKSGNGEIENASLRRGRAPSPRVRGEGWGEGAFPLGSDSRIDPFTPIALQSDLSPHPKSDVSDFGHLYCRTRKHPSSVPGTALTIPMTESHSAENISPGECRVLLVERK
jgi:hypothetical protein